MTPATKCLAYLYFNSGVLNAQYLELMTLEGEANTKPGFVRIS